LERKYSLELPIILEDYLEVVDLITEDNQIYAMIKVNIMDLPNLKFLKTDKKRREYQKDIQKKYRKRKKERRMNRRSHPRQDSEERKPLK
jgi:hypothetical protein